MILYFVFVNKKQKVILHISMSCLFYIKHADMSNYLALILHNFALKHVFMSNKS